MSPRFPGASALLIPLLLAGCATLTPTPDSTTLQHRALAHVTPPAHWLTPGATAGIVDNHWLRQLASPQLNALVAEAEANNPDLKLTAARMDQAAALLKQIGASLYPAVDLLAKGGGQLSGDNTGLKGILLSTHWEIDLWGRIRYGIRASEAQYYAIEADTRFARQSLAAAVAKAWLLAIETNQQYALAQDNLNTTQKLLYIAQSRKAVGAASEAEVLSASTEIDIAQDRLLQLDQLRSQTRQALSLLLGRYPSSQMVLDQAFPLMPDKVPTGLPSQLLERRPDVTAAIERVVAAFNLTAQARAALLPQISLTLGVASLSSSLLALDNHDNPVWSAGASILTPLYQGGALRAEIEVKNAEQQAALASYAQTGLKAFGEVETALAAESTLNQRYQQQLVLCQKVNQLRQIAIRRFEIGAGDERAILLQTRQTLAAESALRQIQRERLTQRVDLYLALGGGFS